MKFYLPSVIGIFLGFGTLVSASPITWTFSGGTFNDGATFTGSFVYDADAPSIFGSGFPPGYITSGSFSTTNGSISQGQTYNLLDVSPHSVVLGGKTEYAFYAGGNETVGIFLDQPMTDAGGTIKVDEVFERKDDYSTGQQVNLYFVDSESPATGVITSSSVAATPEPSTLALIAMPLVIFVLRRRSSVRN